jgi:pimeloyl-ACP methyl ester carboxylesterase
MIEEFEWEGHTVRWAARGSGPPVVMCHGTPWSSFVWRETAEHVVSEHTVYLWDMLGYGASDKPDGDVSLQAQGGILAALLEHWDVGPVDVVTHDLGGAVALRAHLLHGSAFTSMVLADAVALRPWGSAFFRLVADNPEVFSILPAHLHKAMVGAYVASASQRRVSPEVHEALVAPWLGAEGQAAFYRQIVQADQSHTDEIEHMYSSIRIPTLVIWGENDDWLPLDQARRLHRLIPGSRLEVVGEAGHLVQEDRPHYFATLVSDWLSEHGG